MNYTSWEYFVMIGMLLIIYYLIPKTVRWTVLLLGSVYFYCRIISSEKQLCILLISIICSYASALLIEKHSDAKIRQSILFLGIIISILPLLIYKFDGLFGGKFIAGKSIIVPIGLSFYSLQLIAYLIDVYRGKIYAQNNFAKFILFAIFFPQIIQGPIPRYEQLEKQLYEGHDYTFENIIKGIQMIIWGFFSKFMIADKAAIVVDMVFDNYQAYSGVIVWIAAILYCFQLYTDFLSCTSISIGVAQMFGIHLVDNFNHPYFATSIKDFWRRWHMSLSYWLRDYIYIPLGGNKKGKLSKYINLFITFIVSGFWHGSAWNYIAWGGLHALYQIVEQEFKYIYEKIYKIELREESKKMFLFISKIKTFILVMIGWVIFRAENLHVSMSMIRSMFKNNVWILFNDSLFDLGLVWKEWIVLLFSLLTLLVISSFQEKGIVIREWVSRQNLLVRWGIYLIAIWSIWIFGTYGYGYDSNDFIYGGF